MARNIVLIVTALIILGVTLQVCGNSDFSFLVLSDSRHNAYRKAEKACRKNYFGILTRVQDLTSDQYLSLLDCVPHYARFWVQEESGAFDYNVCRKPYSFTSEFVRLECKLITDASGAITYPYICSTDVRPSADDYGSVCWQAPATFSPPYSTLPTTAGPETTENANTTIAPPNTGSQNSSGGAKGAVIAVIILLLIALVVAALVGMYLIRSKRRDIWDKYWCLVKKEEEHTSNAYDSVDPNSMAEPHTYCGLQRSHTQANYADGENSYYSEPNVINPHPDPDAFDGAHVDNIHYILMDNSADREINEINYNTEETNHNIGTKKKSEVSDQVLKDRTAQHETYDTSNAAHCVTDNTRNEIYELAQNVDYEEYPTNERVPDHVTSHSNSGNDATEALSIYELARPV